MIRSLLSSSLRLAQRATTGVVGVGLDTAGAVLRKVGGGGDGNGQDSPVPAPNPAPPREAPVATKAEPEATSPAAAPAEKAPAAKKTPAKRAPVAKKAPAAKKAPVAKKAPAANKAPVARKAPAKKSTSGAVPTPADVADRVARSADEPEHVEAEEVLAYSTGPDVSTTVADEVVDSAKG